MKIALITGAGIRLGKGIAESMLASDYHVILHAHTSFPELKAWVQNHPRSKQVLATIGADLSEASGQEHLSKMVMEAAPHLEVVVHSASIYYPMPFVNIDRDHFRNMQAVNLEAPFFITQALLPMLKKGQSPSVIHILDALWAHPSPQFSHYAASKGALAILTKSLARELRPLIRVNAVAPGAILFAPFVSDELRRKILAKIPLHKPGKVQDIGEAVIFLAEKALSLTGEIIIVDGGRSLCS